jgi:hypothetical protein
MKKIHYILYSCLSILFALAGCSSNDNVADDVNVMKFDILHPSQIASSKATETAFESGDSVGVYISNHNEILQLAGNYANNEKISFDGTNWTPKRTIYWNDGKYDVFAYYPYMPVVSAIDDLPFTVATDQTTQKSGTALGGYEASDFLYAKDTAVVASSSAVKLQFKHRMSRLLVRLVKGDDYEGDLPDTAEVYVHNTIPSATIDMNAGYVTRYQYGTAKTIKANPLGNNKYAAIIVPQRLSNRVPLIEVIAKGVSYLWESTFLFKPGVQHTVTLTIDKNPSQVKIDIGGEIGDWN